MGVPEARFSLPNYVEVSDVALAGYYSYLGK